MITSEGIMTADPDEFALSWLFDLPGQIKELCVNKPPEECEELPIEKDPCVQLLDSHRYSQCHPLLNPGMFLDWCRKDICGGHPEQACIAIGAYSRECLNSGFCVNWHSDLCPAQKCPIDQEYKQCGTSCPKTCESIKEKERKCKEIPTDGCFCPEGKVKLNGTCVEEKECITCDDEGHHPGDIWKKDACTTCSCEGTSLKCETQHCASMETVCEKGYVPIKMPLEKDECCEKYTCSK